MKALIIAAALLLSGCGSTYKVSVSDDKAQIDPASAVTCDPVPDAPKRGEATMGQLYTFADDMVALYGVCAIRDRGKYRWIKSQGH
jgi:hypothetical protein